MVESPLNQMHAIMNLPFHEFFDYAWRIFYASTICFGFEMLFPASRYSLKSRARAAIFWMFYIGIRVVFYSAFETLWIKFDVKPIFTVDFSSLTGSSNFIIRIISYAFVPVLIAVTTEFFYYWFHRAQHTIKMLWRFHEVHHSLREMSAWNSNHHWTEEIFRIPVVVIPLSLLFNFNQGYVPTLVFIIIGMQGQFEHSCMKLNLGALRFVVADNRFHRIHHSVEREHWNRNFGSFTSIWDVIFQTARFPKKTEWPEVGLDYVDEPKTLKEFLFRPFKAGHRPA